MIAPTEPGWLTDPEDATRERWWDGQQWGEFRRQAATGAFELNATPPRTKSRLTGYGWSVIAAWVLVGITLAGGAWVAVGLVESHDSLAKVEKVVDGLEKEMDKLR